MSNSRLKKLVLDFLSNIDISTPRNEQEINVLKESLVKEVLKPHYLDLTLNWKGHFTGRYDGKKLRDVLSTRTEYIPLMFSDLDLELFVVSGSLLCLHLDGKLTDGLLDLYTSPIHMYYYCSICGEKVSFFRVEQTLPCDLPEGLSSYEVELDFPSGRVVLANDLRYYCYDADGIFNEWSKFVSKVTNIASGLSSLRGRAAHASYHSLNGLGYVSTTRSSSIFQVADGSIVIRPMGESDESKYDFQGYVFTDLWAVCLMDYDNLSRILAKKSKTPEDIISLNDLLILKVDPGKYILRVNLYEDVDDQEDGEITATLTKLS